MASEKILLTVAARGGSKGVKNKNIRPLCGLPLIAHTLNQAKRWGKADHIICSTDSEVIAKAARQYGAQVPFMRPNEFSRHRHRHRRLNVHQRLARNRNRRNRNGARSGGKSAEKVSKSFRHLEAIIVCGATDWADEKRTIV